MCGRFTLTAPAREIEELFSVPKIEDFPPRYNIAPTQPILIVTGGSDMRPDANVSGRSAGLVRWGLIPSWVKDLRSFPLLINARAETASEKNAFRAAMKYRRCLIPASGFYEWKRRGSAKPQAFHLRPRSGEPFAFAGLSEHWLAPEGSEMDSAAIVTTRANAALAPIHARMPVVIRQENFERWLNCRDNDPAAVRDLLEPVEDAFFEAIPISDKVNKVANMGPDIQEPVPLSPAPDSTDAAEPQPRLL